MADITTGEILSDLKRRSGLSLQAIADAGGYNGRSSVQAYFQHSYDKALDTEVASKLADALEGHGSPAITRTEIFALTGAPAAQAVVPFEGASMQRMRQDVPILGTALGADRVVDELAIEQTCLYTDEVVGYARRPVILDGRTDAYGLYVQGSSMSPAYEDGDLILAETKRPPRIGDNVVVYLRMRGNGDEADDGERARTVLVKRLVRRSASLIELGQHTPALTFCLDAKEVLKMHRVLTLGDLLS